MLEILLPTLRSQRRLTRLIRLYLTKLLPSLKPSRRSIQTLRIRLIRQFLTLRIRSTTKSAILRNSKLSQLIRSRRTLTLEPAKSIAIGSYIAIELTPTSLPYRLAITALVAPLAQPIVLPLYRPSEEPLPPRPIILNFLILLSLLAKTLRSYTSNRNLRYRARFALSIETTPLRPTGLTISKVVLIDQHSLLLRPSRGRKSITIQPSRLRPTTRMPSILTLLIRTSVKLSIASIPR